MAKELPSMPAGWVAPVMTKEQPVETKVAPVSPKQPSKPLEARTPFNSSSSIKDMQDALINLGKLMSKNYATKLDLSEHPRDGQNPFGKFVVEQYVDQNPNDQKQYVNTDLGQPLRNQTAIQDKGLAGMVQDLTRVGHPGGKGEHSADGIWQGRTDHALSSALSLGQALLQLSKDMGMKVDGFSDKDVSELSKLIPSKYTALKDSAAEVAAQITPYLVKIGQFYQSFEKFILNNDKFKSLITQEKPFAAQTKVEQLDENDQNFLSQNLRAVIPGANLNGKPVTLENISSMNEFKKFLTSINVPIKDQNVVNKYLNMVKQSIETGFNNNMGY